jgi:N-acyl-D-aspartate/D-glutamate deacylase
MFEFSPEQRAIFQYHDGKQVRYGDPLAIQGSLKFVLPNIQQLHQQDERADMLLDSKKRELIAAIEERRKEFDAIKPEQEQWEDYLAAHPVKTVEFTPEENAEIKMGRVARQKLMDGFYEVFEMEKFNDKTGEGATERMVIAVYNHFRDWQKKSAVSTPIPPTSSPSTQESPLPPQASPTSST